MTNHLINQQMKELIKAKAEDGFTYNAIESKKKEDYTANLESLVENGSALTFAIGFQMADAMTEVAKNHTDKHFAIIDSVVDLTKRNIYYF